VFENQRHAMISGSGPQTAPAETDQDCDDQNSQERDPRLARHPGETGAQKCAAHEDDVQLSAGVHVTSSLDYQMTG